MSYPFIACTPKNLPAETWLEAARTAISINPVNKPALAQFAFADGEQPILPPSHLALLTSKYWGSKGVNLTVSFPFDSPATDLRARILSHFNAWGQYANVKFHETSGQGQVRVARTPGEGYWSYLGTDILHIAANQPTMTLDSFTMNTPESEYLRVARHECGHTLGYPHEQQRKEIITLLDPQKTIAYFQQHYGWDAQTTTEQILTLIPDSELTETPETDQLSIMCYSFSPECTKNGQPILGGTDINATDGAFAGKVYPLTTAPPPPPVTYSLPATGTYHLGKTSDGRTHLIFN